MKLQPLFKFSVALILASNSKVFADLQSTTILTTIQDMVMLTTKQVTTNEMNPSSKYAAIILPVSAVLIMIITFVIGFVIFRRRRAHSFTREESGYYANFSRASSNQTKRIKLCRQDDKELPDLKVIDEPIYINMEAPAGQIDQDVHEQIDQHMDHTDNVYANVNHSQ
ncbi:hypothetical protein PAMA_014993 [Pampus argenteus]